MLWNITNHKIEWNIAICSNMDRIDGIIPSEINQTEKDKYVWYHLYVEYKKYNKLVARTKNKQTQRYREQTSSYQGGEVLYSYNLYNAVLC